MKEIQNPPNAPSLMESMRSIGYSLEAALADLIDNSIFAKAKSINIEFRPSDTPYVAIIDDGDGMSKHTLENAMRHGSNRPSTTRDSLDLGRFGLGLKTASLSQCRRMTVASLHNGELSAYQWDLDTVLARNSWAMLELDASEIEAIPHTAMLMQQGSGTIVLWQQLDRLTAGEYTIETALGTQMDYARNHLSLVFHRYINPENGRNRVEIAINRNFIKAIDPFLTDHKATQHLDEDPFLVEGHKVVVKPYILPHISKLSPAEMDRAGGSEGLRNQQGFYIYRNRRLIIWGTWFRLTRKDELGKLARVRVDIPNALDHLWTIDIKKSAAHPPEVVRTNLRRIIARIVGASQRTISFRGRSQSKGELIPAWDEISDRSGVRFDINRNHPSIRSFENRLTGADVAAFKVVLAVIESSFPADALYSQMASDKRPTFNDVGHEGELKAMADQLLANLPTDSPIRLSLLATLHLVEPFNRHQVITQKIIEEIKKNG